MATTAKRRRHPTPPRERIINAARDLFARNGFHGTTTDVLATTASVSVGQLYHHFSSKNDVVLAIVKENALARVEEIKVVFDAVDRGEMAMPEAIQALARTSLEHPGDALIYEMLAEASRNPAVAAHLSELMASYREGVRHLLLHARPEALPSELDANVDVLLSCFIGLPHCKIITGNANVEQTSAAMARLVSGGL